MCQTAINGISQQPRHDKTFIALGDLFTIVMHLTIFRHKVYSSSMQGPREAILFNWMQI